MTTDEFKVQTKAVEVFKKLGDDLKDIESEVTKLGWIQRNELITHVYSNYQNHDKLNKAKSKWEATILRKNVIKWLYELMVKHRDLYGYFENYGL